MTELEKYQRVSNSETFQELIKCLEDFAEEGMIQGRTRKFSVQAMINGMKLWYRDGGNPNSATREWGIRGKMMELNYYGK